MWLTALGNNTTQALGDYLRQYAQGPHAELAGKEIKELRFQQAGNSGDEATLQAFLRDYPSGPNRDRIFGRLDDLIWEKTRKDDVASLRTYLEKLPGGKYVSQARDTIETLTEVDKPAKSSKAAVDTNAEVLKLVDRYVKACNDTNIEELRQSAFIHIMICSQYRSL